MLTLSAIAARGGGAGPLAAGLLKAIAAERLGQAYLFTGADGVALLELAYAFAAARLCPVATAGGDACGACRVCRNVERRVHPDLLQLKPLEGKREIAVSQVRELLGQLMFAAVEAVGRVVIVESTDSMRREGANAFLKTLEEPPRGTLVLLLAARPDLLLATIRSRCQELRLPLTETPPSGAEATPEAEAARILCDPRAGDAFERAREAYGLIDRLVTKACKAAKAEGKGAPSGTGTPTERRRQALLRVFDLGVARLRERFRQRARAGQSVRRSELAIERVLSACRHIEANVTPTLALEALTLDLDELVAGVGPGTQKRGRS